MSVTSKFASLTFSTLILCLAAVTPASAQTAGANRDSKTNVQVRDASPAELKALTEAMQNVTNEEDKDLVVVTHKNGMKSVDLKGRFQSVAVAKRNSDGTISARCVESVEEGTKFLTSKHATPKRTAKKTAEVK